MQRYSVIITPSHHYHFEVEQLPYDPDGRCNYNIYQNGTFVARLEPDGYDSLRVCQNPTDIDLEILHLLAEQILENELGKRLSADLKSLEFDRDDEMEAPPQQSPLI